MKNLLALTLIASASFFASACEDECAQLEVVSPTIRVEFFWDVSEMSEEEKACYSHINIQVDEGGSLINFSREVRINTDNETDWVVADGIQYNDTNHPSAYAKVEWLARDGCEETPSTNIYYLSEFRFGESVFIDTITEQVEIYNQPVQTLNFCNF